MADKPCNKVAVEVVVFLDNNGCVKEVAHAIRHLLANVRNDLTVFLLQLHKLARYTIELLQQRALLPFANPVDAPRCVVELLVEDWQLDLLRWDRNVHVVLDSVEASKNEVEDADGIAQFVVELDDNSGEAAGDVLEDVIAEEEILLRGLEVDLDVLHLHLDAHHRVQLVDTKIIHRFLVFLSTH